jgi:hypothetical protein
VIEVIIDCNNDKVELWQNDLLVCEIKVERPSQYVSFFEELFTRVVEKYVRLVKVDEDTKTTIGEW